MIAPLSLATDLGMGQPMEFALRVAMLAVDLGRRVGLGTADLPDAYYLALVKHIGCTSDSLEVPVALIGHPSSPRCRPC